jgi:hypothetical protein
MKIKLVIIAVRNDLTEIIVKIPLTVVLQRIEKNLRVEKK